MTMNQWQRWLRYFYLRFVRLGATPHEISLGFALGVFWGMFPLPGLQMAIAVVTAAILRGSKIAAAAGTWLSNPLTTLPLTALNFHIGQTVLRREISDLPTEDLRSPDGILQLGSEFLTSYLLGCLVMGTCAGVLIYLLGIPIVTKIQHAQMQRKQRRQR